MTTADQLPEHVLETGKTEGELEEAFADSYLLFNQTTLKYKEAYLQLEEQFELLNVQLEEANSRLRSSLEEKDRVSNYLNNILESMSGGVLVIDMAGRITLFNQAAEAISDRPQSQVLGKHYNEIMGPCGEYSVLNTLKSGKGLTNCQKELRRPDGRSIPLGFSTSLLRDKEGHVLGAVEVFNDLTEVKRLEAQVQRMHTLAALGEMAATVSHEIRNPLGGIAGFAALLERDLEVEDPRRELAQKITEGVGRLNRIVTSLLSYTRPLNLNTRPVDLAEVVEEAAAFLEIDLERHNGSIDLNRNYPDTPLVCPLDPEQFQQVVLNLLQNATQAMPEGGTIDLSVNADSRRAGQMAAVRICDCGVGISPDIRTKLFTPFVTTKEDGTGLGLVTSKKIVEAHGGTIEVESRQGEGTTFTILLPQ